MDVLFAGESDPEADTRLARAAEGLPKVISASLAEFGAVYTKSADGGLAVNPYAVKKLEIDVSYSNQDAGDEAMEFMDAQIKAAHMKRMKIGLGVFGTKNGFV